MEMLTHMQDKYVNDKKVGKKLLQRIILYCKNDKDIMN